MDTAGVVHDEEALDLGTASQMPAAATLLLLLFLRYFGNTSWAQETVVHEIGTFTVHGANPQRVCLSSV